MTLRETVGCAPDASRDEVEARALALILELARERDELLNDLHAKSGEHFVTMVERDELRIALQRIAIGKTLDDVAHPLGEWASMAGRFVSIAQAALSAPKSADVTEWLATHDAEVRAKALVDAADEFAGPSTIEAFSARAHDAYQVEAHRRGDVRHADSYDALSESTKEWDRVLCRWVSWELRRMAATAPARGGAR